MSVSDSKFRRTGLRALILPAATLAAVVASLIAPARAATITFNPGNGAINGIGSFAYTPGNVDASFVSGTSTPAVGNQYNIYYQSILSSANDANSVPLAGAGAGGNFNGSGNEFTVIAGFRETITGGSVTPGGNLNFSVTAPNAFSTSTTPNFFEIFRANPGSANPTAGTGFFQTTAPILTGHVVTPPSGAFGTGNFGNIITTPVNLNGSGNPGSPLGDSAQTIQGNGSTQLLVAVDTFNTAFFPANPFFLTFSTSNFLPETHVIPTNKFSNGNGDANVTANPGSLNGLTGPDVVFESDSSNGFVPEPSSIIQAATAATVIPMFLCFLRRRAKKLVA
jgi:hypothetical protein